MAPRILGQSVKHFWVSEDLPRDLMLPVHSYIEPSIDVLKDDGSIETVHVGSSFGWPRVKYKLMAFDEITAETGGPHFLSQVQRLRAEIIQRRRAYSNDRTVAPYSLKPGEAFRRIDGEWEPDTVDQVALDTWVPSGNCTINGVSCVDFTDGYGRSWAQPKDIARDEFISATPAP